MADTLLGLSIFALAALYVEWVVRDLQKDYNRAGIKQEANRDRSKDWERHRDKK